MTDSLFAHASRRGGWVILVVLVVLLIVMLTMMSTYLKPDPVTQVPQSVQYIDKSDHSAVQANLNSMNTTLQMMMLDNPGKKFTIDELRAKLNPQPSRSGGEYVIGTDNKVYHTGFDDLAPPAEMLSDPNVIHLK